MQISQKTIVLTGATGGIGSHLAQVFAQAGARLILVGRNEVQTQALCQSLPPAFLPHIPLAVDLLTSSGRQRLLSLCEQEEVDILVNNAGTSQFALIDHAQPEAIATLVSLNLSIPMQLAAQLLPLLRRRKTAAIINIGSAFGSIGYPGFSVYCASKFGLRGFTEALRRELADTPVRVLHVAPRATRTTLNSAEVVAMNQALGNAMDDPGDVARFVLQRIQTDRWGSCVMGWPERFYAWINSAFPSITDGALFKQLPVIRKFATGQSSQSNQTIPRFKGET